MSHNQFVPLWSINRASVFVEAVDLAAKADRRAANRRQDGAMTESPHSGSQQPSRTGIKLPHSVFGLSPRFAAAMLGLTLLSGLAITSWIA